ncbi:MAG TPA: hypothetical protein VLJ80_09450 [Solirubrobacteraceae bacterium]|nr:hypothetical protein [Solirubrobacteraceae bacterium]
MNSAAHSHEGAKCRRCRDVIGVYEPMVVLLDGEALLTSRAVADRDLPHDARRYHEACFALSEAADAAE